MNHYKIRLTNPANTALQKHEPQVQDRITDTLIEISEQRKPTNHSKCEVLNNNHRETLYKIRVGEYRAIAELEKPYLNILKIGERSGFYDDVDDIYAGL